MSIQIVLGSLMVAAALPIAWLAVGRPQAATGIALRRSGPRFDRRAEELARSSGDRLFLPALGALARVGRRTTPDAMLVKLESRLASAGLQASWTVERLLAAKVTMGAVGALFGANLLSGSVSLFNVVLAVVLTYGLWYLPDFVVSQRVDERRREIQHALPDTMDQLTIAVEAGLGFESALAHVAGHGSGPLAEELRRTMQDIQLGMDRADALDSMAERTGVQDLQRFLTALRQAGRYGLPIANVLRSQSAELRERR
ncbi:MAG: type II secretion system F family protein, partial [Acidimicrobiia bacterium]